MKEKLEGKPSPLNPFTSGELTLTHVLAILLTVGISHHGTRWLVGWLWEKPFFRNKLESSAKQKPNLDYQPNKSEESEKLVQGITEVKSSKTD